MNNNTNNKTALKELQVYAHLSSYKPQPEKQQENKGLQVYAALSETPRTSRPSKSKKCQPKKTKCQPKKTKSQPKKTKSTSSLAKEFAPYASLSTYRVSKPKDEGLKAYAHLSTVSH